MKYFLSLLAITFSLISKGQIDSNKIFNCKELKKGFYKNYNEFINNSPSIIKNFTVTPLGKSKSDSTIIGAEYKLQDSLETLDHIWGFCDGNAVYVNYSHSIFTNRYWKLECIGPFPFFTFKYKNIGGNGPRLLGLATGAIAAASAAEYDLMTINEKGKFKEPSISLLKKLLANTPDLLKSFTEETDKYEKYENPNSEEFVPDGTEEEIDRILKDYLIKLNIISKK